jgi:hypothetical protein
MPVTLQGRSEGKAAARLRRGLRRPQPRRRLRREVRLAGYLMICLLTLIWVPRVLLFRSEGSAVEARSGRTGAGRGRAGTAFRTVPAPAISISIEPAGLAPYAGAESPVVFPGYLLPDDGCEEPAHAGS